MLLAIFSPQKLTRFNIASFLCRFIPNRMKEEHGHVMASMSYLQGGTNLGWKKKTYLRCSMLVVNAVGKSCSVPVYQFSYSIQWICWFQDHLKQDEGPARPCNGFYVLFCLCRTIGTIRTTWDGKKSFWRCSMLVVNLVSEIMFHSLVSFFLTAYNEYVDSNILSNACQPGHVQPGLPGAGSTAVP